VVHSEQAHKINEKQDYMFKNSRVPNFVRIDKPMLSVKNISWRDKKYGDR